MSGGTRGYRWLPDLRTLAWTNWWLGLQAIVFSVLPVTTLSPTARLCYGGMGVWAVIYAVLTFHHLRTGRL